VVPCTGIEHAATIGEALDNAFAEGADDRDEEDDNDFEEEENMGSAPSTNPAMWVEDDSGRDGASLGSPGGDFLRGRREEIDEGHGITLGRWAASPFRQRGT